MFFGEHVAARLISTHLENARGIPSLFNLRDDVLRARARAILADPDVLILNEATSSVDTRTEKRIQEALLRLMKGRTSFVIAHRLSTIRDADAIIALEHGKIVDMGPHAELMARKGFYHDLYMSQFKEELR